MSVGLIRGNAVVVIGFTVMMLLAKYCFALLLLLLDYLGVVVCVLSPSASSRDRSLLRWESSMIVINDW